MVLLAEFGYGCVAADHGEDATIGVDEGSGGFATDGGEDVPCTLPASLLGDGCELRQGLAIGVGGIGQIANDVDVVEPGDAEVGLYLESSVWFARRNGLRRPSERRTSFGVTSLTAVPRRSCTPCSLSAVAA